MRTIYILLILSIASFSGCKKPGNLDPTIIIHVKINGNYYTAGNAKVYAKRTNPHDTAQSLAQYPLSQDVNSFGTATFENIPGDKYYFYAVAGTYTAQMNMVLESRTGRDRYDRGITYSRDMNLSQ